MPTETGRVIKRKQVKLPDGSTVDIPVVTQITFLDVVNQAQESEFHIENSGAAHRDVHVAGIPGGGAATDESGGGSDSDLKVERIEVWRVLDVVDRGQESFIHLDNKTVKEPPDAPPYFTTHEKTHIVKYINTPDDGNWIKSELIDRFKVLDTVDQGQEHEYFLLNPPDNQDISGLTLGTDNDGPTIAVDPSLPDISDSSNGVDPPWRTDPFQNIVDFKKEEKVIHHKVWEISVSQGVNFNEDNAENHFPFEPPGTNQPSVPATDAIFVVISITTGQSGWTGFSAQDTRLIGRGLPPQPGLSVSGTPPERVFPEVLYQLGAEPPIYAGAQGGRTFISAAIGGYSIDWTISSSLIASHYSWSDQTGPVIFQGGVACTVGGNQTWGASYSGAGLVLIDSTAPTAPEDRGTYLPYTSREIPQVGGPSILRVYLSKNGVNVPGAPADQP